VRIQTCQAENLPELMEKIRVRFGPEAILISVRRVSPSAPELSHLPFVVEGSVSFKSSETSTRQALSPAAMLSKEYDNRAPNSALGAQLAAEMDSVRPAWLQNAAQQIKASIQPKAPIPATGIISLVGPMGAGKTTTAAKIAGRLARSTQNSVGVISTDTERPGGSALLMAYAAELGLHGTEAPTAADLQDRIQRWNGRGPLVIDTRGCGPRDSWGIERLGALLDMSRAGDERYLVLSATEHPAIARECLKAYATIGIKGVVLTRVDQAAGIGHCLDEVRARKMSVKFIGTGERVPEDLTEPSAENLRAIEMSKPLVAAYSEAI